MSRCHTVANATELLKLVRQHYCKTSNANRANSEAFDYLNRAIRLLERVTTKSPDPNKRGPGY